MKKWFIAAAAVAAIGVGGAAMAQGSAQCQVDPDSCSGVVNPALGGYPNPGGNGYLARNLALSRFYGNGYVPGSAYAYNQHRYVQPQYRHRSHYARTRRDRDGDGVPNAHDRYPNDPNRR